jgi:NADH-quinone oxidoreductase subunit K
MSASFATAWYFAALLFFIGLYCMAASRNLLRQLIGLEVMSKGSLLALIASGAMSNLSLAQAVIITMIVIEVVVVAAGLVLLVKAYRANGGVDVWKLSSLKG